jgi:hypothetical protein
MITKPDHDKPGHDRPDHDKPDHDKPGHDAPDPRRVRLRGTLSDAEPGSRASRDVEAPVPPTLTQLLPLSACVGDPSFMLRAIGTGFDNLSVIVVAGQDEETVFVSDTELTTGWNMPLWVGPDPAIPVLVRSAAGLDSNVVTFALAPAREVPLPEAHASIPSPVIQQI